jgi:hypothetical protein
MEANVKLYSQNDNIVRRDIADETILVPIRGNLADMQRIYALDPVADFIWNQLDGRQSAGKIHSAIVDNFDVDTQQAALDLNEFIDKLLQANLIEEVT